MSSALPEPSVDELARSDELRAQIVAEIAASGPLYFDDYMRRCLYQPRLGYYASGQVRFGEGGDFVTAPELSPLFGAALARPVAASLEQLGGGAVLELGAGSGALAVSLLAALEAAGAAPREYLILETSAALAARQRETIAARLPQWLDRLRWLDRWPEHFCGVLLANEVLDAMPVARFAIGADGPREIGVGVTADEDGGALAELELPPRARIGAALAALEADLAAPLPAGYRSELNADLHGWIQGLSQCLARGAALLIDYGYPRREYYAAERVSGTLRGHYRQRAFDDALRWPGLCDLSAHVDFSAAALAARDAGLRHEGFATQAAFLLDCGIAALAEAAQAAAGSELERLRIAQQLCALTLPGQMGERFRVLGLSRGLPRPLPGFAAGDLSSRL